MAGNTTGFDSIGSRIEEWVTPAVGRADLGGSVAEESGEGVAEAVVWIRTTARHTRTAVKAERDPNHGEVGDGIDDDAVEAVVEPGQGSDTVGGGGDRRGSCLQRSDEAASAVWW